MKRLLLLWLAVLWAAVAAAADAVPVPPLTAHVTDLTGTLAADQRQTLEDRLARLEAAKGTQIAVVMLPTTQPETIEEFGIRVAEAWKIGRKGTDDGVIVIVAKEDRRMRIEVGYGLEGALNDATASRIVNERMGPRFQQGDYAGGLRDGVEAIAAVVEGEPLPAPAGSRARTSSSGGEDWLMWIFGALVFASFARRIFGGFGALMAAGAAGFFAFIAFGLFAAVGVGVLVFLLSFAPPGLFLGGGRFGGGGRGGFSGGGGGFGGGGASGRW